ncbi:uncharacterized protein LOC103676095 isoform X3 [Ursus maritimus]|uniref:Uncharacterized protein LOC103676095 isoform X3 n=1 Tax=Ursus maritimus TaxID=29073 RepID=A0A8M1F6I0_URSMA|nr:uncharacterized protein LOC103676095 isoform X3 [Ursus maritimus]
MTEPPKCPCIMFQTEEILPTTTGEKITTGGKIVASYSTCQATQDLRLEITHTSFSNTRISFPSEGFSWRNFLLGSSSSRRKLGPVLSKVRHDIRIGSGGRFGRKAVAINIEEDEQILGDIETLYTTTVEEMPVNVAHSTRSCGRGNSFCARCSSPEGHENPVPIIILLGSQGGSATTLEPSLKHLISSLSFH